MRIVIMGPFPPFRGGIANFNSALVKTIKKRNHQVFPINFTTQYPNILFPGKSQFDLLYPQDVGSRIFSSINPVTWIKTVDIIIRLKPDLIIFRYWLPFFAPAFGSLVQLLRRKINPEILVICDNVTPHERRFFDLALTRYFFNQVDHFIVMSKSVQTDLLALLPDAHFDLIPHPLYDLFGPLLVKEKVRKMLRLKEKRIILYFGFIRPYKGVDILIRAIKILKNRLDDFRVLIVGECYDDADDYVKLVGEMGVGGVTTLEMDFIPNQKVAQYFSAADLVVLPYKSATQSGVVPIAFHFNKPVVVTNVGGLPEIVPNGKAGYVVEGTAEKISEAVIRFFNENKMAAFSHYIQNYKQRFSWDSFTEKLEMLVQ